MPGPYKIKGKGTLLKVSISGTPTVVGHRTSIDPPEPEMQHFDGTHLDSTAMEPETTLIDNKESALEILYDPNDPVHKYIEAARDAGSTESWTLVYADGLTTPASEAFTGFVKSFKKSGVKVAEYLKGTITIVLKSSPVRTAGTP